MLDLVMYPPDGVSVCISAGTLQWGGCVPQGPTSEVRAVPLASLACLVLITGQVLCDVPTGQLLVLLL